VFLTNHVVSQALTNHGHCAMVAFPLLKYCCEKSLSQALLGTFEISVASCPAVGGYSPDEKYLVKANITTRVLLSVD